MAETTQSGHPPSLADVACNSEYISHLQSDGRLLLRFVARRVDRALPKTPPPATNFDVLFVPPESILPESGRLADLLHCIDELSHRAAPANVRSIRLTSAYLKYAIEDNEPPPTVANEVRNLRWSVRIVTGIAMLLLPLSIGLLAHMDNGRRLLQQLNTLRQQEQDIRRDIAALPLGETETWQIEIAQSQAVRPPDDKPATVVPPPPAQRAADGNANTDDDGVQVCSKPPNILAGKVIITGDARATALDPLAPGRRLISWRMPITQKALAVCQRYDDSRVRLAMIYTGLADWNCLSHKMFSFYLVERMFAPITALWSEPDNSGACGAPTTPLPPEIDTMTWRSHETWVTMTTAVVAGFILPLLLGCLGGCTYVLRRFDRKVSDSTLQAHDGGHALTRVALAALLGGLSGVIWTADSSVTLGGITLSLAAIAFFIGFSVEGVFKAIETLIGKATDWLDKAAPPPPTAKSFDGA
jgi:hypothetical protein